MLPAANGQSILSRLLTFGLPTVAAINGHAFAGGFLLSLACDHRVMRTERGFLCMNEIDIGFALTPGMNALLDAKLPKHVMRDTVLQGRRWTAEEAVAQGFVDAVEAVEGLPAAAAAVAASHAPKGANSALVGARKTQDDA